jgi:hypothetical protein
MKKLFMLLTALMSFNCFAERQTGEITGIIPYESGGKKLYFVQVRNNIFEGCNVTGRFVFDDSKLNHQAMWAMIMASYYAKTPVSIEYTKTCNVWGNGYDLVYVCAGSIPC